ncbi:hypothetical protein LMG32289_01540 [Cupriavidus pampae]|uniref:Uncharacterized protein n=2 Tax=Cupriavidus pampae TaxID=659251 RepID=A0ABM8WP03_9BURK|nr:hypothetical protein LMG32289_01540 [Cupriavidus pampae]
MQADLAAVNALLETHTEETDPLGWHQFLYRKRKLEADIAELVSTDEPKAEVAIFFGGAPVRGSHGVLASFASQSVDAIQDIVAKRMSTMGGTQLAARGPVPGRADAQLMITNLVRGSVGFVLTEAGRSEQSTDTSLKDAVQSAVDLLAHIASADDEVFDAASDELDSRTLDAVRKLFRVLDDNRATIRIVEGKRDLLLPAEAVSRGRGRVEAIESINEEEMEAEGHLFLLPDGHRFDLTTDQAGRGLLFKGTVDRDILSAEDSTVSEVVGKRWRVLLRRKDVSRRACVRTSYVLIRLLDAI